jgi:hypothetical protein
MHDFGHGCLVSFLINYRVANLDRMLEQLRRSGVKIEKVDHDYGRWAWIMDPEGNRIELWEPKKKSGRLPAVQQNRTWAQVAIERSPRGGSIDAIMMESDWRKFRDMVPLLRERYLAARNRRLSALLTDPTKTETERFWDAVEVMEREARVLRQCLDGHSRSKMGLYILTMIRAGMLTREDMPGFSEDLQKKVSYAFEEQEG